MKSIIEKIALRARISEDKAKEALFAISNHVREQFPLLQSIVLLMLELKEPPLENKNPFIGRFPEIEFSHN
ncbi:MAG TPA: hypothetical protein VK588_09145 [Chitinophagaceae bacterium]|nr:hypothetical protein [Chitinophagaceae bacterium]